MKDAQTFEALLTAVAAVDLDRVTGGEFVPQTLTGWPKQMPDRQLWDERRVNPGVK